MSNVLYRNFNLDMPQADHAEGSWIWDQKGKKYLDMSGGAFVNALGHGRKDLIQRIADRMKNLSYVNGWHFTSSPMEEYAQKILSYAPKGFSHVGLLSSGSEAVEAAIKIVRQSFCEEGKTKKHKVIARSPGYHGNVGMAFAASARKNYKKYFAPYISEVAFVSAPLEDHIDNNENINFAEELEKRILELGPETVSTFIVETIMGSSGACSVPPQNYFASVVAVCKKYDVKIIADEVACGAGRTGEYFACQHFNFVPDVIVMGKGVNAGLIPTSVLLVSEEIISKIKKGSGGFMHHQTYMHSPMMASCALEVLLEIEKESLILKVKEDGIFLGELLKKELLTLPHVGRISGKGFFWGVTVVKDKEKNSFFSAEEKIVMKLFKKSKELGVVLWPVTGEEESLQSDAFVLAPPYIMSRAEMQEGVQKLKETLSF
ncbi:MAG: aminotransferase class III-fold pyridoxal phosphate-dependent enzyme [bacterium]